MGDVIKFDGITRLDIPANDVLGGAVDANLESAVVMGYDQEGEFYFASSIANGPDVLWLMENLKKMLIEADG